MGNCLWLDIPKVNIKIWDVMRKWVMLVSQVLSSTGCVVSKLVPSTRMVTVHSLSLLLTKSAAHLQSLLLDNEITMRGSD